MIIVQHFRGLKEHYNVNVHGSGIYFATDTNEIIHNNKVYLGNTPLEIEDLKNKVSENTNLLLTLNGEGDGSIQKQITLAINEFATKISDDNTVNTFKELVDYAAENTDAIGSLILRVEKAEDAIDTHELQIESLNTELITTKDELLMKIEAEVSETRQLIDEKISNAFEWEEREL